MQSRQKVWPQLGSVCGRVYGWAHRGQVRVERRWDKVDDMGTVVLEMGGRAIGLLLVVELSLSAAEAAAAAAAAEDDDEEPAILVARLSWLRVCLFKRRTPMERSEALPPFFHDGRLRLAGPARAGPAGLPSKIMALAKPQGCRFGIRWFLLCGALIHKNRRSREPLLWRDAGAAPARSIRTRQRLER